VMSNVDIQMDDASIPCSKTGTSRAVCVLVIRNGERVFALVRKETKIVHVDDQRKISSMQLF
jgi:catabolite regulation protein CreA